MKKRQTYRHVTRITDGWMFMGQCKDSTLCKVGEFIMLVTTTNCKPEQLKIYKKKVHNVKISAYETFLVML